MQEPPPALAYLTKLHEAATQDDIDGIDHLLLVGKMDVDTPTTDPAHLTPLWFAVWNGCDTAVRKLLDEGANAMARNQVNKKTVLHAAAMAKGTSTIAKMLILRCADVHAVDRMGESPIHVAAGYDCVATMRILVANGADPNARSLSFLFTPLHRAAYEGKAESATYLVDECDANTEATDLRGCRPLHRAVRNASNMPRNTDPCARVARLLLERGTTLTTQDPWEKSW